MKKKLTSVSVKVNDKASDNDMKKSASKSKAAKPALVVVVASVKPTGPVNVGIRSVGNSEPVDVGAC
jgi:hypothetical protein